MSLWFRMYSEMLNDPDIQTLPLASFKAYINALCLAGSDPSSGGNIGTLDRVSFAFRETKQAVSSAFHALIESELIVTDGETFQIPTWRKRQFKSDSSTERVKRFRKRGGNVTETPSEQNRTDTEQNREKQRFIAPLSEPDPNLSERIEAIIRKHPQNRQTPAPVRAWFQNEIASSANPEALVSAIERWQENYLATTETKFVANLRRCLENGDWMSSGSTHKPHVNGSLTPAPDPADLIARIKRGEA